MDSGVSDGTGHGHPRRFVGAVTGRASQAHRTGGGVDVGLHRRSPAVTANVTVRACVAVKIMVHYDGRKRDCVFIMATITAVSGFGVEPGS